jgi:hypothetical protein
MTNPARRELLRVLERLAEECPDVRFGQLIANLSYLAKGATAEAVWEVEDQELLAAAKRQLEQQQARRPSVA